MCDKSIVIVDCSCSDHTHSIRFDLDVFDNQPELQIYATLDSYHSLWQRIKIAYRYIVGLKTRNEYTDTLIVDEKNIDNIISICQKFKQLVKNHEA